MISMATVRVTRQRTAELWRAMAKDPAVPTTVLDFMMVLEQRVSDLEAHAGFEEKSAIQVLEEISKIDTQGR